MRSFFVFAAVAVLGSAFRLPFKLIAPAPVTNVTSGGQFIQLQDNAYFAVNITIGTPAQVFTVVADTGSSDLWIADKQCIIKTGVCASDECTGVFCSDTCPNIHCCIQLPPPGADASTCNGKRQFDSTASSTYTSQNTAWIVSNKYGTTSGVIGNDIVTLGDDPIASITVPGAYFGQGTHMPDGLVNLTHIDGVLGLGFAGLSSSGNTPVFLQAIQQGDVADSIITIWLEHQWQLSDNGSSGDLFYGGYDLRHCNPNPITAPLTRATDYFQFTMNNFMFSTFTYNLRAQAIVDTSLNVIRAPLQVVTQVYKAFGLTVNGQMQPNIDCNAKMDLQFSISGKASDIVHVTETDIIYQNGDGTCRFAFVVAPDMNGDKGARFDLGIPIMRGRCTFFDYTRHTVGFGLDVYDYPPTTASSLHA